MKATGIVRRIDDLGRVVIPKEIRRTLRIREGDPLEIYTEKDGEVIFKKYSPMGELSSYAAEICESLYKSTGGTVAVCDRDSMIAVSGGGKKELLEKPVSKALEEIMENRRAVRTDSGSRPAGRIGGGSRHRGGRADPGRGRRARLCDVPLAPRLSGGDGSGIQARADGGGIPRAADGGLTAKTVKIFFRLGVDGRHKLW
mgnify:CR=1 FL=1